jgi:hypothetical protein
MGEEGADLADQAGTANARRILARSERTMEDLLAALDLYAEQILNGELTSLADVTKARIALASARVQLLDEVKKHEERCAFDRGLLAAAPLDFDTLRDEIGRKLDLLRDARGAEGVS